MSLNPIERSGLCSSPDGSPPSPPTTLLSARDIVTQFHALGIENLKPANIRLALTQCTEPFLNKLGQLWLPVIEVSAPELATDVYEIREGTILRGGNLLPVVPVVDTRTNRPYPLILEIERGQLGYRDRIGKFHPWRCDPVNRTIAALIISKPAHLSPEDPDSFDIYPAIITADYHDLFDYEDHLINSPKAAHEQEPAATAVEPAPPLPVTPSSSSTQEAIARPRRIERAAAPKEQPPVAIKVPLEKSKVLATTTPASVEPEGGAGTVFEAEAAVTTTSVAEIGTSPIIWNKLSALFSSLPPLERKVADIPNGSRTGYIHRTGTEIFLHAAGDNAPFTLIITGIRQNQLARWRSQPPSNINDLLNVLSPDAPDRLRLTLRRGENGTIVIGDTAIMMRRRDKSTKPTQIYFKPEYVPSSISPEIIMELMNLAKPQARPDIPRSRPPRSEDIYTRGR